MKETPQTTKVIDLVGITDKYWQRMAIDIISQDGEKGWECLHMAIIEAFNVGMVEGNCEDCGAHD